MNTRTVDAAGGIHYHNEQGHLHREDGPAYKTPEVESWYSNGLLHRDDGPAVVYPDGTFGWCLNGCVYDNLEHWLTALKIGEPEKTALRIRWMR